MTAASLTIRVHGTPAPQGSKRAYVRGGRAMLVESSAAVKPWREAVKHAALDALAGRGGQGGFGREPVRVTIMFLLPRPKSHYRTGKHADQLRVAAPLYPAGRPDLDKAVRAVFDALGDAGTWVDDAQVVVLIASKQYEGPLVPPGALIDVTSLAVAS